MSDDVPNMQLAPIVMTVYNRPWHTEQTLSALKANDLADQSVLYIYCDGPKHLALPEDLEKIAKVRQLAKSEQWCKEVNVIESQHNIGLVNSFIKAVTEAVNRHGRVIVLEDDQVTSKGFLKYLNEALEIYKDDKQVMHVSAYMYPAKFTSRETTFFLSVQSCPGWATWKRAWAHYNHDGADHLKYFSQTRRRKKEFDIEGHAYFFKQLERNAGPELYSFAVRWYASCIRAGGLSLFPARSLIQNIGLDDSGLHCQGGTMYHVEPVDYLPIKREPIVENSRIRQSVDVFYRQHLRKALSHRVKEALKDTYSKLQLAKVKRLLRRSVRLIYPEFAVFDGPQGQSVLARNSLQSSAISEKAAITSPHHIWDSTVGDYTFISRNSWISKTEIGKFCSVGPNWVCGWGIHPVDGISTSPMFYSTLKQNGMTLSGTDKVQERKPIKIGNDVFIGMNVTILDGVKVGDGAVIGAGCVVSKDVPPYAIVVGCPMQILRYRFSEDTIAKLLKIKWWDWPQDRLREVEKHFFDVDDFVNEYENLFETLVARPHPHRPAKTSEPTFRH